MNPKIKALKEVLLNALNVRKIVDEQLRRQLRITEMNRNTSLLSTRGISDSRYDNNEIIVSLTTYGRRIYQVHLVIESLLEQTLKPNRIILWLDQEEFKRRDDLPLKLIRLCNRGLQIEFCKNLRSYNKLIPTLQQYPASIVITVDDDVLYPEDLVERLYKAYIKDPGKVYFYRGHKMVVTNGNLQPYNSWKFETELDEPSLLNFPTGVGGVLYTMNLLDEEVLNVENFTNLAPLADDVWFKAMSLKKRILCEQIKLECPFREKFIFLETEDTGLATENVMQNKNDEQIASVFRYYNLFNVINKL